MALPVGRRTRRILFCSLALALTALQAAQADLVIGSGPSLSAPPPSFIFFSSGLKRMNITVFATDNLYADMEYPFHVTVRLADIVTGELISGAHVTVEAQYLGGKVEPWTENFTAYPDPPPEGYYTATIPHTGAGLYNFTVFARAKGYEPVTAWISRVVKTRPTRGPEPPIGGAVMVILLQAFLIFGIPIIIARLYSRRKRRKSVRFKRGG